MIFFYKKKSVERGAEVVREPWEESDEDGVVRFAQVKTYGECTHTLIDRSKYNGLFLPNFGPPRERDVLLEKLPKTNLQFIDHIVGNQPDNEMANVADW